MYTHLHIHINCVNHLFEGHILPRSWALSQPYLQHITQSFGEPAKRGNGQDVDGLAARSAPNALHLGPTRDGARVDPWAPLSGQQAQEPKNLNMSPVGKKGWIPPPFCYFFGGRVPIPKKSANQTRMPIPFPHEKPLDICVGFEPPKASKIQVLGSWVFCLAPTYHERGCVQRW